MNTNYIGNNRQNDISEALINSTKIKTDKTNSYKKHNFDICFSCYGNWTRREIVIHKMNYQGKTTDLLSVEGRLQEYLEKTTEI